MKPVLTRLIHFWEAVRSSYWLLPGLMLLCAMVLSYGLLAVDNHIDLAQFRAFQWLIYATPDGARVVLSTIATSTFAAATLTFSVTMVTLNLTSSQFGPRLLRNFLRDPFNQFIFGAFIATFIYCLLILRGMGVNGERIPNLSVSFSIVMVLFDAALFIWFIHHVTSSIRIEYITAEIGKEFIDDVNSLFPEEYQPDKVVQDDWAEPDQPYSLIHGEKYGYIQAIDYKALETVAEAENITIKILHKPGHFALPGAALVKVWPLIHLKSHIDEPIRKSFLMGAAPTAEQDVLFTIRQLVQVAARALSPGINDPFTAMTCIDYLAAGLALAATRKLPDACVINEQDRLLLIKNVVKFEDISHACFRIIRQMSVDNLPVAIYLLDSLDELIHIVRRHEDREALLRTARLMTEAAIIKCATAQDKKALQARFDALVK